MYRSHSLIFSVALAVATSPLLLSGCANGFEASRSRPLLDSTRASPPPGILSLDVSNRFPGAVILDQSDFIRSVVGRRFRYRLVGSNVVVERPTESFTADGGYVLHRMRSTGYGSYSMTDGFITVAGPTLFLGLGTRRVFFRHEGRLFTTDARGAEVYELEPAS